MTELKSIISNIRDLNLKTMTDIELRALRDRVEQEIAARRFEERLLWEVRRQVRNPASIG
jgi:hypothetical protein